MIGSHIIGRGEVVGEKIIPSIVPAPRRRVPHKHIHDQKITHPSIWGHPYISNKIGGCPIVAVGFHSAVTAKPETRIRTDGQKLAHPSIWRHPEISHMLN